MFDGRSGNGLRRRILLAPASAGASTAAALGLVRGKTHLVLNSTSCARG